MYSDADFLTAIIWLAGLVYLLHQVPDASEGYEDDAE